MCVIFLQIEEDFRNLYGRVTADGVTQKWTEGFAAKVKEYGLKQKTVVTRVLKEDGKGTVIFSNYNETNLKNLGSTLLT